MTTDAGLLGFFYLGLVVGAVVLLVVWIILPFAVFSMRDTLRALLSEQRHTNDLLRRLGKD